MLDIKKVNSQEWISVYIFHEISFEKLISGLVKEIIDDLDSMSLIESFFFIRYWKGGPHIRLRFLPKSTKSIEKVMRTISKGIDRYFCELKDAAKYTYQFNSYVKEERRYGGDGKMEIAEQQFHASSKTVINLIHSNYDFWDYSLAMSFAIQMHLCLSKSLFLKKDEEISFYQTFYENWLIHAKGIDGKVENVERFKIKTLIESFESSYEKQKSRIENLIESIENAHEEWQTQWKADCSEIARLYDVYKPDRYLVYSSLMHMTNNRLGIHISDESFIAFLIFKGLEGKVFESE